MTDNPGGKYRTYDYGYIPKYEKIPEGYTRTLRPCMACASSVTYIDKDKTWHCLKCGWSCGVNDTHVSASIENTADSGKENKDSEIREEEENGMALPYSDHDFEMVKKGLEQGKTVSAISASIGRGTDALNHKIKVWREEGRLPESKRGKEKPVGTDKTETVNTSKHIPCSPEPINNNDLLDELEKIKIGINDGLTVKQIADRLGKDYDYIWSKIREIYADAKSNGDTSIASEPFKPLTKYERFVQFEKQIKELQSDLKKADDVAYEYEEQVKDLQSQLKSQHEYIHALEEVDASVKPSPSRPMTSNERVANALLKAQEGGMELSDMSWTSSKSVVLSFILRVAKTETETQA